jgi:hypothetical protein
VHKVRFLVSAGRCTAHVREADAHAQELMDRYNPLVDLTSEERIEATARRVGLNMPITVKKDSEE